MGGSAVQGFKNIITRNVRLLGFEKPLVERGISGLGSDGTVTNVDYDIDIMDKATTDLDLTSANRRMAVRKLGQIIQTVYPVPNHTPATSTDTGSTGEVTWDSNYIYVATANNTWKRAALSSW